MYKRKQFGILKYGKKASKPVKKFQEGGFVGYAPLYQWQDDPYELALLRQKMYQDRTKAMYKKKSSSSSSTKTPKINYDEFSVIEGGLRGMNNAANKLYREAQERYFSKIEENGPEWINTFEAQKLHSEIENMGKKLANELKFAKENFDELKKGLDDEDKDMLAISTDNNVFAVSTDGQIGKISLAEYLQNPSKYNVLKNKDVIEWRKNSPVFDTSIETEFLGSGAIGNKKFYERFIKPFEDKFQYKILDNKQLVKVQADRNPTLVGNKLQISKGITNKMMGRNFYDGMDINVSNEEAINNAIATVFEDALKFNEDRSTLEATLKAQVLSNREVKKQLMAEKDPEKRAQLLYQKMQYQFFKNFYDKGVKRASDSSSSSSSSGGSGGGGTQGFTNNSNTSTDSPSAIPSGNAITTSLWLNINEKIPSAKKSFQRDVDAAKGVKGNKEGIELPRIATGELSTAALNVVTPDIDTDDITKEDLKNTKVTTNEALSKFTVNDLKDSLGMLGPDGKPIATYVGSDNVPDWLQSSVRLAPGKSASIVFLPVNSDGEVVIEQTLKMDKVKSKVREEFVRYRKNIGKPVKADPDELLPGNLEKEKQTAYLEYTEWIKKANKVEEYEEALKNAKTEKEKKLIKQNLRDARAASKAVKDAEVELKNLFKNKKVILKAFADVPVVINDDGDYKFKEKFDEKNKNTIFKHLIKDVSSTEREYIDKVVKIDQSRWGNMIDWPWNWGDDNYSTNIFIPLKNPAEYIASQGGKDTQVVNAANTWDVINRAINTEFVVANGSVEQLQNLLIH